ncbi:NAD(P)-dependent alcohol dehydrogenase [Rhodococcus sp. NPDC003382]
MKAIAAVLRTPGGPFEVEELKVGEPGPGEAIVDFAATGICHTDLTAGAVLPTLGPIVLGHEGAGTVTAIGPGVAEVAVGDRVVASFSSCGNCPSCLSGRPAYCRDFVASNVSTGRADGTQAFTDGDGNSVGSHFFGQSSFASRAVVKVRNLVPIPDYIPLEIAGVLGCSVQTGVGAVIRALRPEPNSSIIITGTGAVGLSAVMGAAIAECYPIVAVDTSPERLQAAKEIGATHTLNGVAPDIEDAARALVPQGFDYAIDTSGVAAVIRRTVSLLSTSGTCGLIGLADQEVTFGLGDLLLGRTVRGIIEGDAVPGDFVPRLIDLWQRGELPFDSFLTSYPVAEINTAIADLASARTTKAVITFPAP